MAHDPETAARATMLAARLLAGARNPEAPAVRCYARLLAWRAARGYGPGCAPDALDALLQRHFPGAPALRAELGGPSMSAALPRRADEVEEVCSLLLPAASPDDPDAGWLAVVVAEGCLGDDHLWQDLGLEQRDQLGWLLDTHFGSLARRNVADMKWKRFFYKQLCDREQVMCRAPSCGVCADYARCYGSETGGAAAFPAAGTPPGAPSADTSADAASARTPAPPGQRRG